MLYFSKMTGIGNDYVYINCMDVEMNLNTKTDMEILKSNITKFTKKISNRNFGVGSDGVILIENSNIADAKMRIFNSDGSEAKMCGNGIRCVGKYLYDNYIVSKKYMKIETLSGVKDITINTSKYNSSTCDTVQVNMGIPSIDAKKICLKLDGENMIKKVNLKVLKKVLKLYITGIGNLHAVCFVENVENIDVRAYGSAIEKNSIFKDGINVEFVEIISNDTIKMRVWERGSGETLACGSGACASAFVSYYLKKISNSKINVKLLGGNLNIRIDSNFYVYMCGDASYCFDGKLEIEKYV